ncbi:Pentatricopeptide repeat-containing protein, partial [Ananas comosus]
MKAFSRGGAIEEVLRLFNELKGSECSPNVLCYNTVINALVIADRPREAQAMFDEMLLSGVAPNVSSYNILVKLHSWCSKQFDLAYEVIARMRACGFTPDSTTYSTLICGLCRAGRIGEAWGVLDWMLEEKCRPTVHTYTPIVLSYCSEGQIEEAKTLMAAMESVGCRPNTVTYNILIRALCNAGRFDEVEQFLVERWTPNSVTYNTYMSVLCKRSMGRKHWPVEKMLSLGLHPTIFTLAFFLIVFVVVQ